MAIATIDNTILDIIKEFGPVTTKEILEYAKKKKLSLDKEYVNSVLYGDFREVVVRERNQFNLPTWRLKTQAFEAAKGYEARLYQALIEQKVVTMDEIFLDYEMRNRRNRKTYHLDLAIITNEQKYNIEVDGFEHMRADARLSIQRQVKEKGEKSEIEIDWMDNETSYVDFKKIERTLVNKWCSKNLPWCITYHEELLWPHDITRNIWLIDNGWRVMRLWNVEVRNNLAGCLKEISEWIES